MAKFLHHNDFGYCVRCPHSGYLHLCFGTVALALTAGEFAGFREQVAEAHYQQAQRPPADPDARCVALRTTAHRLALVFTLGELLRLQELVEMTGLLLEAELLLGNGPASCESCNCGR